MRILFESISVGVAVALIAMLVLVPPSWPVAVLAIWLAVSLFVGAGWSIIRARRKAQAVLDRAREEALAFHRTGRAAKTRPPVKLTGQALTRLNIQRRATGRPPLSPAGYHRAIEKAPAETLRSQNDWLLYFLLWSSTDETPGYPSGYAQSHVTIPHSLEIQPGGGQFGGGGASGMWTADPVIDDGMSKPIATGAAADMAQANYDAVRQTFEVPEGYQAVRDNKDRATGEVVPDPFPVNPTPSEDSAPASTHDDADAADTSSSSSDNSSSSSDSGGGGGGDGGGGGGGGGD